MNGLQAADSCPEHRCDGSGWLVEEETNTARPCGCREQRINRVRNRQIGTGIPRRFRGVSFERKPLCDLDPHVLREVRDFVEHIEQRLDSGAGLWFQGDHGTGKTSLAMLVSRTALQRGRSVAIYSLPRLLADIRETYGEGARSSYMQLFQELCTVDLLHIDDLGAEHRTDWVLEQLYSIVNERWQDERSIVVTTNRPWEDLREEIGWRTVSRLMEICGEPIPIMGADLRVVYSPPGD